MNEDIIIFGVAGDRRKEVGERHDERRRRNSEHLIEGFLQDMLQTSVIMHSSSGSNSMQKVIEEARKALLDCESDDDDDFEDFAVNNDFKIKPVQLPPESAFDE